ncbi:hypothetical protein AMTRI_Chr04g251100 [Amborella trichopoda]
MRVEALVLYLTVAWIAPCVSMEDGWKSYQCARSKSDNSLQKVCLRFENQIPVQRLFH